MLSVIYLTYRPGGYDVLVDGLRNQTYQNYELICVDEIMSRQDVVLKYLKKHDIPVTYVGPSKPKCFPELPFNLINAYNTGTLQSRGDVVILLNDYIWLPPNNLEKIVDRVNELGEMTAISNAAYYSPCQKGEHMNHSISIWENSWQGQPLTGPLWVGNPFELFYAAFPFPLLLKTNGFPECYDYHRANQIVPLLEKIKEVDGSIYVDRENAGYHLDHRGWGGSLWHQAQKAGEGKLIIRENCFNLKTHKRGTLPKNDRKTT